jgi:hypothetical protein
MDMSKNQPIRMGRGSRRRRLRKVGFWENWSISMTILVIILLFGGLVVIPWLAGLSVNDTQYSPSIDSSQPAIH